MTVYTPGTVYVCGGCCNQYEDMESALECHPPEPKKDWVCAQCGKPWSQWSRQVPDQPPTEYCRTCISVDLSARDFESPEELTAYFVANGPAREERFLWSWAWYQTFRGVKDRKEDTDA